jgi:oxidase EvaA
MPLNDLMTDSTTRARLRAALEGFSTRKVALKAGEAWALDDGAIVHKSRGFFSVVGARFDGAPDAVLLYQPQSAIAGLLGKMEGSGASFLLQTRVEPGLVNGAQLAPTVQSTLANYLRVHGGHPTPHIEYFTTYKADAVPHCESSQFDLGERYLMKVKRSSVIEVCPEVQAGGTLVWVSAAELRLAVLESYYLDMDLRALIALAPWTATGTGFCIEPASPAIRKSLREAIRPAVVGQILASLDGRSSFRGFVPVTALENWECNEWGLFEKDPVDGFSVEYFETQSTSREVPSWVQPLINSHSPGRVVLFLRKSRGIVEVLVRTSHERGFPNGSAVCASYVRYPGRPVGGVEDRFDGQADSLRILARTEECDEGGRFFQDTNIYEVIEVGGGDAPVDGVWVSVAELKFLLGRSQVCSIQLRAISSMLLGVDV